MLYLWLKIQRGQQQKLADELFVPISNRIEPDSIEYRLQLYRERLELERRGIEYRIIKERFLNWRLEYALLKARREVVASHILPYPTLRGFT